MTRNGRGIVVAMIWTGRPFTVLKDVHKDSCRRMISLRPFSNAATSRGRKGDRRRVRCRRYCPAPSGPKTIAVVGQRRAAGFLGLEAGEWKGPYRLLYFGLIRRFGSPGSLRSAIQTASAPEFRYAGLDGFLKRSGRLKGNVRPIQKNYRGCSLARFGGRRPDPRQHRLDRSPRRDILALRIRLG